MARVCEREKVMGQVNLGGVWMCVREGGGRKGQRKWRDG